jgi:hypothetical protein
MSQTSVLLATAVVMRLMIVKMTLAVVDSAVNEENSGVEEEGPGHSLGDAVCNSGFIWEDIDNYHIQLELFSGHSGPRNCNKCSRYCVCVFIIFQ